MENGTANFTISTNCLNSYLNTGAHTDNGHGVMRSRWSVRSAGSRVRSQNSCPLLRYVLPPLTKHHGQCATGSKILTEREPDQIGFILAGTGPDYKPEKFNRIRPDFLKTLTLNLKVTNINMASSCYKAVAI